MWKIAEISVPLVSSFIIKMKPENCLILDIPLTSNYIMNDCHNNVNKYIYDNHDSEKILGYYLLTNEENTELLAIQHSVILQNDKIIDITPCVFVNKLFIYGYKLPEFASIHTDGRYIKIENTQINYIDGYVV